MTTAPSFMAMLLTSSLLKSATTHQPLLPLSSFPRPNTISFSPIKPKLLSNNTNRLRARPLSLITSALVSEEDAVQSTSSSTNSFKLTYLEGNSWLWDVDGLKILVDPILVGNLDFGIPWLYDASKKYLKNFQLSDLPKIDCLLITQSLDDHCHLKTLKPLSQMFPDVQVIATPNAEALLSPLFSNVTYLEPGQNCEVEGKIGSNVRVRATPGPILGPPWQRPENGYIITSQQNQMSLYYEPHCVYDKDLLEKEQVDIVITPVIKQLLPKFTLVSGQEDAVQLAKLLQARFVVSMRNGDLDSKGFLAAIVRTGGTMESFKDLLLKEIPDAQVTYLEPGESCEVQGKIGSKVKIRATPGHKGLPWKRPENGYIITSLQDELTLYFEPHCIYNKELEKEQADIIITPVVKLMLSRLTLIPGQEDAVKLATLLKAKFVVPMHNGDLDAKGLLPKYSRTVGTVESFKELLSEDLPDAQVLEPTPGVALRIPPLPTAPVM